MGKDKLRIIENHPLSGLTTFDAGGPAGYYAAVSSDADVVEALEFARGRSLPVFVLGGGSNLLVSDDGFPGLVIHNRIRGFESNPDGEHVVVSAGAGEEWGEFADRCVAAGWQGVECLAGIPGSVGACPVQNIGAYGQDVSEAIAGVSVIETESGNSVLLDKGECQFGYRRSIFNSGAYGKYIITGVDFRLTQNGRPETRYRELELRLGDDPDITLTKVRDAVMKIREAKGLLSGDGIESFRSAGSFFRNPVVATETFRDINELVRLAGGCHEWAWPTEDGRVKISAACLIERAGFVRGYRSGNVGISPRHTLIIINYGGATAREVAGFAARVQGKVLDEFGLFLMPEIRLVGFPINALLAC
jgi:UDP-N-acetylmuramate dehydrogenase